MQEIKVTDLRVGMVIVEDRTKRTPIRTLSPCTQRGKVHVNEKDCYDYVGNVTVI